eukprot:9199527-Ditylum_brightwellii.AAC.1
MLKGDVCRPWRLTTELSEHFFAICCFVINSFTINDWLFIVPKNERFLKALQNGNFKVSWEKPKGYKAKAGTDHSTHDKDFQGGPMKIVQSEAIDALLTIGDDDRSVAAQIWNVLKELDNIFKQCNQKKDQELFKKEDVVVAPNPKNVVAPNENPLNDPVVISIISDNDDDVSNNDEKFKFVEETIHVDLQYRMDMDLVCDVTGMEKEEEEDVIIKDDLSSESNENATAAYTNLCMVMSSVKKSSFWSSGGHKQDLLASIDELLLEKNCKNGDVNKAQGVKCLSHQWFEGKANETKKGKKQYIQRGSIVSLNNTEKLYCVLGVFNVQGKKWFLLNTGQDPA